MKKTEYDGKIESKYITTADYNKFNKDIFTNKVKRERLINKSDIV